jgi:uncharacterized protein (TIGR02996 family)
MPRESDFLRAIAADKHNQALVLIYADWLEEQGREKDANSLRGLPTTGYDWSNHRVSCAFDVSAPKELKDCDWQQVFAYAGEPGENTSKMKIEPALPNDDIALTPFYRADVKRVIALSEGERDEKEWIVVGELWDGRFFVIAAGCDYTGWD